MLSVITTKQNKTKTKGHKKTLGGVGYVYYLVDGDGIRAVCICPTHETVLINYVQFLLYQLYFNKAVL